MKATKARGGAGRAAERDSAADLFPQRREARGGASRSSSSRRPARRATTSTTADPLEPAIDVPATPGLWPGVMVGAEVPTEVPRIDDVMRPPLRAPAGSPQPHTHARSSGVGAGRTSAAGPADVARAAAGRANVARAAVTRRAQRHLGRVRRTQGIWSRPPMLVATAAVALLVGVACGMGYDVVRGGAATDDDVAPPTTPQACAVTQVAWARSANAQVAMSAEKPDTLVAGFAGARDALAGVQPPAAIAADWSTVVTYVNEVAKAVDEVEDEADVEGAVVAALSRLDTPGMTEAAQRITAYLKADCEL